MISYMVDLEDIVTMVLVRHCFTQDRNKSLRLKLHILNVMIFTYVYVCIYTMYVEANISPMQ